MLQLPPPSRRPCVGTSSSGPEALNGLIFESRFVRHVELIVIEYLAGISRLCAAGKYDVSSVVKIEENMV